MHRLVRLLYLTWLVTSGKGHLIDGIFTEPTLEPGYNLVATVPRGALALNVTELRHTQNYLAIRLQDGSYLLNGNYSINWSGEYKAAGTTFVYLRQSPQNLESFSAVGPLHESIDVMVLYQEPNPGIVYRYIIPENVPIGHHLAHNAVSSKHVEPDSPHTSYRKTDRSSLPTDDGTLSPHISRRYKKRKLFWKSNGLTECSKPCGGGVQTIRYICIREHTQSQVPDKRCHAIEKPTEPRLKCNIRPCPAKWRAGSWGECSVSCGSGVRSREIECVQEVRPSLSMRVADGACMEPSTLPSTEACHMPSCQNEIKTIQTGSLHLRWNVGAWSQCSTSCGPGKRTRTVTCLTYGFACDADDRPVSQEFCDLGPCPTRTASINASVGQHSPQWLYTEWSEQCSSECGTGVQTRKIACGDNADEELCDSENRPESSRTCSSNRTCGGQWFTGPWTECSAHCDVGEQAREVVCVTTLHGSLRVVLDMNCPADKPETTKVCRGPPCTATWFISDWTECSRSCGAGIQKREVRCLIPEVRSVESHQLHCADESRPVTRRMCNDYPCKDEAQGGDNHYRALQVQNDPEISNGLEENPHCRDSIANCNLVTQARLCSYQFYQKSCCHSCSRAKQEFD